MINIKYTTEYGARKYISAGAWILTESQDKSGAPKINVTGGAGNSLGEIRNLPYAVADWFIDKCVREHLPSADMTNENIPKIIRMYNEMNPQAKVAERPNPSSVVEPMTLNRK